MGYLYGWPGLRVGIRAASTTKSSFTSVNDSLREPNDGALTGTTPPGRLDALLTTKIVAAMFVCPVDHPAVLDTRLLFSEVNQPFSAGLGWN